MKTRPLHVVAASLVLAVLTVVLVSCQQGASPTARKSMSNEPKPIDTQWSATTVPTTQTAKLLGFNFPPAPTGVGRADDDAVKAGSRSCVVCHQTDSHTMHETSVRLACVDCHGGHPDVSVPDGISPKDPKYRVLTLAAHVQPKKVAAE